MLFMLQHSDRSENFLYDGKQYIFLDEIYNTYN